MKFKYAGKSMYVAVLAAVVAVYFCIFLMYSLFGEENRRRELDAALTSLTADIENKFIDKMRTAAKKVAANEVVADGAWPDRPGKNKKILDYMETIRAYIGADIIYLMDKKGNVIISTSHKGDDLTGQNYAFRPYFKNAIKGEGYVYPAVGVTTLKSGYFFSAPVRSQNGAVEAVIVIKTGLEEVQKIIDSYSLRIAIVSPEGIIFQSNQKSWSLKKVMPLEKEKIAQVIERRQFGDGPFEELGVYVKKERGRQEFDGILSYSQDRPLQMNGWKVMAFESAAVKYRASDFETIILASVTAAMTGVLALVILLVYDRRKKGKMLEAERAYREIFDSINDAIYVYDKNDFSLVDVNKRSCEILGMTREEILKYVPLYANEIHYSPEKMLEYMRKVAEGEAQLFEWKAASSDGRSVMVEVSLKKAVIGGSERIIAVVRDISERIETREKIARVVLDLKKSNDELESFVYFTSHDLKEPLRMVSGYLQLLERRYADKLDQNAREFIKYAVEGAVNMNGLIDDLLSLSRISTKNVDFESVDMNLVLENIKAALKFVIEETGARIIAEKLPVVKADRLQIHQLLQNLLANALKFRAKEPPLIEIRSERKGGMHKIWVKDNGIGIAGEYFEKIFIVFQRLHSRVDYPGTGIGLAICKKIVERHGGSIWVESEPGKGASFYFTLPAE